MDFTITSGAAPADLQIADGSITVGAGLDTAVYVSLFSDPYWGDELDIAADNTPSISKIISTQTLSNALRLEIIDAAKQKLAWMIEENLASRVEIQAIIRTPGRLDLEIALYEPSSGSDVAQVIRYALNWETLQEEIA